MTGAGQAAFSRQNGPEGCEMAGAGHVAFSHHNLSPGSNEALARSFIPEKIETQHLVPEDWIDIEQTSFSRWKTKGTSGHDRQAQPRSHVSLQCANVLDFAS